MKGSRTIYERERDLVDISRLLLKGSDTGGLNYQDATEWIAANRPYTLGVNTIRRDIKEIMVRWKGTQIRNVDELKAKELAKIDAIEAEAWRAWFSSAEPKTDDVTEERIDAATDSSGDQSQGYKQTKHIQKVTIRDPNPAFMKIIMWCVAQRAKILDLYPAQRVEVKDWRKEAERYGYDPGALFNDMVGRFVEDHPTMGGSGSTGSPPTSPEDSP